MKEGEILKLKDKKVGFILTGSFYTFRNTIPEMKKIIDEGAEVIPIMSDYAYGLDTRYGKSGDFVKDIEKITNKEIIHTIQDVEPIGQKHLTDIMIVAPATRKYYSKDCKWNYRQYCNSCN